ncbi:MAG: triose-phosphate isomerase [Phycisphaerae bacterium]|nr:triose-phosphate isomerase [Phycisphaerae bacterium]
MTTRRPFVGGNWKMNTDRAGASALARGVVDGLVGLQGVDVAVFPPFPYLLTVASILRERGSSIRLGAQDASDQPDGALTGEVSLAMLRDCGVSVVLTGHSERRHVLGEGETIVHAKTRAALAADLECVLCVGEKLDEREAGRTNHVCEEQVRLGLREVPPEHVDRLTIAYEPVWAIGTGRTASPADAQDAQRHIRGVLADLYGNDAASRIRIMYGGSVKASNARELFAQADVDGGLIGGASLKATEFVAIVKAAAGVGAKAATL